MLEAEIMKVQLTARDKGYLGLADDLQEVLASYPRDIGGGGKRNLLKDQTLLG